MIPSPADRNKLSDLRCQQLELRRDIDHVQSTTNQFCLVAKRLGVALTDEMQTELNFSTLEGGTTSLASSGSSTGISGLDVSAHPKVIEAAKNCLFVNEELRAMRDIALPPLLQVQSKAKVALGVAEARPEAGPIKQAEKLTKQLSEMTEILLSCAGGFVETLDELLVFVEGAGLLQLDQSIELIQAVKSLSFLWANKSRLEQAQTQYRQLQGVLKADLSRFEQLEPAARNDATVCELKRDFKALAEKVNQLHEDYLSETPETLIEKFKVKLDSARNALTDPNLEPQKREGIEQQISQLESAIKLEEIRGQRDMGMTYRNIAGSIHGLHQGLVSLMDQPDIGINLGVVDVMVGMTAVADFELVSDHTDQLVSIQTRAKTLYANLQTRLDALLVEQLEGMGFEAPTVQKYSQIQKRASRKEKNATNASSPVSPLQSKPEAHPKASPKLQAQPQPQPQPQPVRTHVRLDELGDVYSGLQEQLRPLSNRVHQLMETIWGTLVEIEQLKVGLESAAETSGQRPDQQAVLQDRISGLEAQAVKLKRELKQANEALLPKNS